MTFFDKYILTTYRFMISKWWLSIIKIISLVTGMLSFLLVWFFYIDHQYSLLQPSLWLNLSSDAMLILSGIVLVNIALYGFMVRSQLQGRYKAFFIRRYYGETWLGIMKIIMIETTIYVLISVVICLVLLDLVTPAFNDFTGKSINFRSTFNMVNVILILSTLMAVEVVVGGISAFVNRHITAADLLHKIDSSAG